MLLKTIILKEFVIIKSEFSSANPYEIYETYKINTK